MDIEPQYRSKRLKLFWILGPLISMLLSCRNWIHSSNPLHLAQARVSTYSLQSVLAPKEKTFQPSTLGKGQQMPRFLQWQYGDFTSRHRWIPGLVNPDLQHTTHYCFHVCCMCPSLRANAICEHWMGWLFLRNRMGKNIPPTYETWMTAFMVLTTVSWW